MVSRKLGGRYRILSHLGGGGFGQTYLAEDWHLPGHPRCVVKQLKPRKTDEVSLEAARRLFDAEADALYHLGSHDCIPRLLAHFEENQQFFLVQELIDGVLLSDELDSDQPVSEAQVIELLRDVLKTLCFVHQEQVIHRDIKPSNLIRRNSDQRIVLIDFGSVKQVSSQPIQEEDGQVSITIAIGSMGYMPNEQLAGQPCLSSDVYAVGMLGIQALTGVEPKRFRKDPRTSEILWRDLTSVSPALANIIDKMVRYDYRQRYLSAEDALAALNEIAPLPIDLAQPTQAGSEVNYAELDGHLAWLERGEELFNQNRYREAAACFDKVVQVQPSNAVVWFKCGIAFENIDAFEDAIAAYDRVLQLQPDDYLAWLKRGQALEKLQRYPQALASYEEVLRLQPDNYWVWNDKGHVLELLQNIDDAIQAYTRAVQLKPDFQLAMDNRKRLLQGLKRAEHLYQLQHYDEVVAACDQAIQTDPKNADAWLMRGMALEKMGRPTDATLSYDKVVKLQPEDHIAWFKLGSVLEALNQNHRAALAYSQVIRLQPSNYWAWYQRGKMLEQLQQPRKALAAFNRAIQLKADFKPALRDRQRLLSDLLESSESSVPKHQIHPSPSVAVP